MNTEDYLQTIKTLEYEYHDSLPAPFWEDFAREWFHETAPEKTEDYGTEAWMRMGSLGILAELSGCHYRCRRFMERGQLLWSAGVPNLPVHNAVLDSFGYSVMLRVCVGVEMSYDPGVVWRTALQAQDPAADNEYLLNTHWDNRLWPVDGLAVTVALRSALNAWRLLS